MPDDTPGEPRRPMGKGTLTVRQKQIAKEIEEKRIAAAVERDRLALEVRKLDLADRDGARDDRRALLRTGLSGLAVLVALGLVGLAIAWDRGLSFHGFGFEATTKGMGADQPPSGPEGSPANEPPPTDRPNPFGPEDDALIGPP